MPSPSMYRIGNRPSSHHCLGSVCVDRKYEAGLKTVSGSNVSLAPNADELGSKQENYTLGPTACRSQLESCYQPQPMSYVYLTHASHCATILLEAMTLANRNYILPRLESPPPCTDCVSQPRARTWDSSYWLLHRSQNPIHKHSRIHKCRMVLLMFHARTCMHNCQGPACALLLRLSSFHISNRRKVSNSRHSCMAPSLIRQQALISF